MIRFAAAVGAHDLATVAPGLHGYYYRVRPGLVTVPVIQAVEPGHGACSAFLDALPTDECIEFRCVLSPILADALVRRGFVRTPIFVPELRDVDFDAWVKAPACAPPSPERAAAEAVEAEAMDEARSGRG